MSFFDVPLGSESVESLFDENSEAVIWLQRILNPSKEDDSIPGNAYLEIYKEGRLSFGSPLIDIVRERLYGIPAIPVYLLPGSVNFHYGPRRLCAIAKELVKLDEDEYKESIFVYRNKRRSQLLELRMWPEDKPTLIRYGSKRWDQYRFLDDEWPRNGASVKIMFMEEYDAMLKRMLSGMEDFEAKLERTVTRE